MFEPNYANIPCKSKHSFTLTDPTVGEIICTECGTVISDSVLETSTQRQWHLVVNSEHARSGTPMSMHEQGFSTLIGRKNRDHTGKTIVDSSVLSVLARIRTWDSRTQTRDSRIKSRKDAFGQLDRLKQKLGLPGSVIENAAYIYRKVQQKGLLTGRTRAGIAAACVYIACREAMIPRTSSEVAEACNIRHKEMWKAYMTIAKELDLKIPLIDPVKCLLKLANNTGVDEKVKRRGTRFMKQIIDGNISAGRDPMGLAATVLYIACQNCGDTSKSQQYFAHAAGVSDMTIRNRYQELRSKVLSGKLFWFNSNTALFMK